MYFFSSQDGVGFSVRTCLYDYQISDSFEETFFWQPTFPYVDVWPVPYDDGKDSGSFRQNVIFCFFYFVQTPKCKILRFLIIWRYFQYLLNAYLPQYKDMVFAGFTSISQVICCCFISPCIKNVRRVAKVLKVKIKTILTCILRNQNHIAVCWTSFTEFSAQIFQETLAQYPSYEKIEA